MHQVEDEEDIPPEKSVELHNSMWLDNILKHAYQAIIIYKFANRYNSEAPIYYA